VTTWKSLKFVTGNANKVREASEILGVPVEQVSFDHLEEVQTDDIVQLVEHKVRQAYVECQCPVLVEDSGLIFNAWKSLPGVLVKWFEKSVGCEGMLKMLREYEDRSARALCSVAVYDGENMIVAQGEVSGAIATEIRGQGGFGWDVIFIPDGHYRTYAEMNATEKNAISHRRKAFEALKEKLQ
jgi:non-canonical purine NTP pyrophosphatase (RdgB/HAM1 family)